MIHRIYSSNEITGILGAKLYSANPEKIQVQDILIDSRRLITAENTMFFALITKRNNGHKYIDSLYEMGVKIFTVSEYRQEFKVFSDAHFFVVNDTLEALQKLAAYHRRLFQIPVIGITGSNGKTIVKEWLNQLMSKDKSIVRSPKSYNSQIGVPLSVWQINEENELAIIEAGISEPEEMYKLRTIIKPTIGVFTNIGEAHSENFINTRQKVGEKLKLFTKVDTLIYNSDQKELQEVVIISGILNNIKSFCWGKGEGCDLRIVEIKSSQNQTMVKGIYKNTTLEITIPFIDKASIENATHCWAVMLYLGYKQEVIAERFPDLAPIAMRLELKEGSNNCTIINDTYNSDFNSLSIALDFLNQQNQHKEKVLILSDILQSGRNEADLYSEVNDLLEKKGVTRLIGIGPAISGQNKLFTIPKQFYNSTAEFISGYPMGDFSNQTILLKGARLFEFEQISRLLQQKVHETVLEINLDALVHNLNYYRSKLKNPVKIMAMVKAFSYGSGGFEIANVLQFHRVDYLAVAYADEGVELRQAGITLPIMVMNADEYAFDIMIKHQLEPEVFSFRALDLLEKAIVQNALPLNKPVKIHIKLDTGMKRLGFEEQDIDVLIQRLLGNPLIYVQSVFSHLAGSDEVHLDDFSVLQIDRFKKMAEKIENGLDKKILKHILNSAGISRFPKATYDMVRLGIGLYGIATAKNETDFLKPVARFRSVLAQIRTVKKGESVGYNRNYISDSDRRIGIVSVGYADGLMRNLGNGAISLAINGRLAPIIGNVCMDMCMVDLTGITAEEGDDVIIFDEKHPVTEMAEAAKTIPYEILSRISRRVKRVYFHE